MMQEPLPYTVRPMEPDDVPTIVAIDRLSFPMPWPASSYLYELNQKNLSFFYVLLKPAAEETTPPDQGWRRWLRDVMGTSRDQNRVIGYAGFRLCQGPEAHISTIALHPDWHRRGLGELLLLTVIEQALGMGVNVVSLEVRASNQVAQRLYRKYGFRFQGVHRNYYRDGEDAWLMNTEVDGEVYHTRLTRLRQALEARLRQEME